MARSTISSTPSTVDSRLFDIDLSPTPFSDDSVEDPDFLPAPSPFKTNDVERDATACLNTPRSVVGTEKRSRKRPSNPCNWKKVVKKRQREQGKEYVTDSGKLRPAKSVQPAKCGKECAHNCISYFTESMRQQIHQYFWTLNDAEKKLFYTKYITLRSPKRKRVLHESRKKKTFEYHLAFDNNIHRVCQSFFLAVLNISQRTIYYFFKNNFDPVVHAPIPSKKGKHVKKKTSEIQLQCVRAHIEKFPCVDSHYVRAKSEKQYLESGLTLMKMYRMYLDENRNNAVKYNIYRNIFNTEYNLGFFKPKKDQCDIHLKYENLSEPTLQEKQIFDKHVKLNDSAKQRKAGDKILVKENKNIALICYDLQKVFALPQGYAGNFYYKRKLSCFNLTAHCSADNNTYCAIWYETQSGRSANDLASALMKILRCIANNNSTLKHFIMWSDACVPQNKNKIMSLAILKFLEDNKQIKTISQRFSEPGHSRIQEVDAVHAVIDRHLKNICIYSPISLLRNLKDMNYPKVSLKILQCSSKDFLNFNSATIGLNFSSVKYNSAKEIFYDTNDLCHITFQEEYGEFAEKRKVPIFVNKKNRQSTLRSKPELPKIAVLKSNFITKEKVNDLKSMLPFMPSEDVNFYKTILKLP